MYINISSPPYNHPLLRWGGSGDKLPLYKLMQSYDDELQFHGRVLAADSDYLPGGS